MSSIRVGADSLASALSQIMEEYGQEVKKKMDEIIPKIAKDTVKELKANSSSSFEGSGKYAKGWKQKTTETAFGVEAIVYNTSPGLPHLLEFGHAKQNGGRVGGRTHIAPAEQNAVNQLIKKLKEELGK